uniref:Uncharacterized protein n=1 Tax=Romanomermis culicivorax TaxID=13658 RepID=A0A915JL09_ROMCU
MNNIEDDVREKWTYQILAFIARRRRSNKHPEPIGRDLRPRRDRKNPRPSHKTEMKKLFGHWFMLHKRKIRDYSSKNECQ